MYSLSDTHCHLDLEQFDADRQDVLQRTWESGIQRIIIPQVHMDTIDTALRMAKADARISLSVGIHPNSADQWTPQTCSFIHELLDHPSVCAIGEIGLDYYRDHTPPALQQQVFIEQLSLAAEAVKPVILHCRDAFEDLIRILTDWLAILPDSCAKLRKIPGVMHSFDGQLEQAQAAIQSGFMLGINGSISFKNAEKIKHIVRSVGSDFLLLETDAPYLTPAPHRGERNEPAYIRHTNDALAAVLGISSEQCAKITYNNACKTFMW